MNQKVTRLFYVVISMVICTAMFCSLNLSVSAAGNGNQPGSAALVKAMGVGWNLGNSLDAVNPSAGYYLDTESLWGNPVVTRKLILGVYAAGFRTIRIPVTYYNHIDENGMIDARWLDRVEQVVGYALEKDMYVIINVHHDTGMDLSYKWIAADPDTIEEDRANLTSLWRQIAARFKDYDYHLIFEATNEIMDQAADSYDTAGYKVVHGLNQAFIDTVRAVGSYNANRFLAVSTYGAIVKTATLQGALEGGFTDPAKDRLLLAVHGYSVDIATIDYSIQKVASVAKQYGMSAYIGEFGSKNTVKESTRVAAAKEYVKMGKKYGVACLWWDNGGSYQLMDRKTGRVVYPKIISALMK